MEDYTGRCMMIHTSLPAGSVAAVPAAAARTAAATAGATAASNTLGTM
jgi:hypothetical protein